MSYAERRSNKLTGWWYAEAWHTRQDGTEVRFRRRFKVKAEADGYEAYVRATGTEPPGMGPQVPSDAFRKVAHAFLEHNPSWGRRDEGAHQRLAWIIDKLGDMPVASIRTKQIDAVITDLRRRPTSHGTLSPASINRYLAALSTVLRWAWKRDMIPGVPNVPMLREGSGRKLVVSQEQEQAILRWLAQHRPPEVALCIRVLVETGMRRGELYKLRPDQIENEFIVLSEEQTKTDEPRLVPIEPNLARDLRAVVASRALPTKNRLWSSFKCAVKACGYDERITIHTLRHTRGTRLLAAGADIRLVAAILGHSNLNTTKRYTHPDRATLSAAAKKVHHLGGDLAENGTSGLVVPLMKSIG